VLQSIVYSEGCKNMYNNNSSTFCSGGGSNGDSDNAAVMFLKKVN
jgi:hypothetical protein